MKHIMDQVGIYIIENDIRLPYKRIYHDHNIPNYIPAEPIPPYKDLSVDQVLFLPIEMDTFRNDHDGYHVGYRYMFSSTGHETLSLFNDPNITGTTKMQVTATVQRFRYKIKSETDIAVDLVCDPLYPPRIFDIQSPTKSVSSQTLDLITKLINQNNAWYIDKNV